MDEMSDEVWIVQYRFNLYVDDEWKPTFDWLCPTKEMAEQIAKERSNADHDIEYRSCPYRPVEENAQPAHGERKR